MSEPIRPNQLQCSTRSRRDGAESSGHCSIATCLTAVCCAINVLIASAGKVPAAPPAAAEAGGGSPEHWSYKPLTRPAVPDTSKSKYAGWVRTPVDAFILAELEARGMHPSPPADKRTLLRRVYFDLTGLPPTPQAMAAFLADDSPGAYAKVVDELLASPRYGERWARHWMDLVHFAETHGHDQDRPRPSAWPYRDYLIGSFNTDKPYARFVEEQIAGDVLYPDDPQAVVALGMVAAGPWDESSLMAIMDDTVDKKVARYLDRDDMVMTAMSTFVSTTVHCARCHDHKFDPIPQREYYALQAVFAGVDRANRPYDADPQVYRKRRELLKQQAALASASPGALLTPEVQTEVAAWEASQASREATWTVLDPASFSSAGGAAPAKQPDGSILFAGPRPEKDVYAVQAFTTLKKVTAVRLEVLPDDSLPGHGPGRAENGNFHLSEFKLIAGPRAKGGTVGGVTLQNPSADFDQDGWTIAMAVDGKPETAWGIHPAEGKRHIAVFELKEPVGFGDDGTTLTFTLEQSHGRGHVIGRLRLSATSSPLPVRASMFPDAIASILATSPDRRTDAQRAALALHVVKGRLDRQLAALPPPQMVYADANDFAPEGNFKPANGCRPIQVLRRGDINAPLADAAPGALSCVRGLDSTFKLPDANDEGARRAALAKWMSDPKNVLTWRSIVNRVWHHHFGRGIVDTPSDFGRMGGLPSHPQLLDWLAIWFIDASGGGGSLKKLHRLIVTSSVYMQSSEYDAEFAKVDADNRLLWRMNRSRLDAESIRDAVLQITGKLDLTMGGPSVKQFIESPGIHVTPNVDYLNFDVDNPAFHRRSVYRFIFRTLPDPFMETLDCPDASQLTPARSASVTALQALSMMNDAFLVRYSEHLAEKLSATTTDPAAQIDALYELTFNRPPTTDERGAILSYATKHGLPNACRLLLNSNEFMFVN
jgi:hypothetical protein